MAVPTATVTFVYDPGGAGETTLTLPSPEPAYRPEVQRAQARGQNAAGEPYVYDKAVTNRFLDVTFLLTAAQKNSLISFFTTTVQGAVNTFTYTDHLSTAHAGCRLWGDLDFQKTRANMFRITVRLRTTTDPD